MIKSKFIESMDKLSRLSRGWKKTGSEYTDGYIHIIPNEGTFTLKVTNTEDDFENSFEYSKVKQIDFGVNRIIMKDGDVYVLD